MFTVVYVVVDDEELFFYNEMMKSLTSLRMHMPEQRVCILVDDYTYNHLKEINAEAFKLAEIVCVSVGEGYNQREKSRLLKLTLRERFQTYVIKGQKKSKIFCVNGAAARKVQKGDKIIICSYRYITEEETENYSPTIVQIDNDNNMV